MESRTHLPLSSRGTRLAFGALWAVLALLAGLAAWALLAASDAFGQARSPGGRESALHLPWQEAGLTERQAAAHLLDRLAFGARPGEVDRLVEMGLETWVQRQLAADLPEPMLDKKLDRLRTLDMSPRQIVETYPNPGLVMIQAVQAGVVDRESLEQADQQRGEGERGRGMNPQRRKVLEWAREQGYRPQREMLRELATWKVMSAVYAENQLEQVLADFWSNHLYVSRADNEVRSFLLSYERDAVRPHVLGNFAGMLTATARHPAMLLYLDNARSVAPEGARKTFDRERFQRQRDQVARRGFQGRGDRPRDEERARRRPTGLNENYARELLELHTLGVDGGYTQEDVIEVARAFTGWTLIPPGQMGERIQQTLRRNPQVTRVGFVVDQENLFLFRADAHDAGAKTVLGTRLPAGGGVEDGERVLELVAHHPSTARHLARKLAVRFVSDDPPESLVERLAGTFTRSRGDLRAVMRTLVESPEFWSLGASRAQKIKSPLELTISAVRAVDAAVLDARGIVDALERLGQPLWGYQAPTGYPDRADFWVNTGALLARMNFGLELAAGRLPGVRHDLAALNQEDQGREPESAEEALEVYLPLLLPERGSSEMEETLRRLRPMVRDPQLAKKVEERAPEVEVDPELSGGEAEEESWSAGDPASLAQVVGVILGSPEFQRR